MRAILAEEFNRLPMHDPKLSLDEQHRGSRMRMHTADGSLERGYSLEKRRGRWDIVYDLIVPEKWKDMKFLEN